MSKNEPMDRTMKPKEAVPEFASREEEATFWDTHDLADYWDELKPVKVRFAKNLSEGLHIRLDPETMTALRSEAQQVGIGPTTLARMWIRERLRQERAQSTDTS